MESFLAFFTLFSLLLFASSIDGRKDPSEYWKGVMQDQPMPEALRGLVHADPALSLSHKDTKGQTSTDMSNNGQLELVKDFENKEEKPFVKDFEPKPNISVYHDDIKPTEDKSFVKDFEPKPNISVYHDDVGPKDDKSFVKDFEPRPSATAYQG